MERERGRGQLEPDSEPSNPPSALPRLVGEARAAQGLNRMAIAARINALLIAMRQPGNEAAEAKAILGELDVSALDGLVDGHGRDCRKEAVETLLACGFPHALEVSPEDLAHARKRAPRRGKPSHLTELEAPALDAIVPVLAMGAGLVQFAGALYSLFENLAGLDSAFVSMLGAVVVSGAGAVLQKIKKPELAWIPLVGMLVGAALGVQAGIAARNPLLAAAAIVGAGTLVTKLKGTRRE